MGIIVFIAGILLFSLINIAFYVAGGYFMLFRTALNDNLNARTKLGWMWMQVVLPVTSAGYLVLVEKSNNVRLVVGTLLLACALAIGYGTMEVPWEKVNEFALQTRALLDAVAAMHRVNAAHKPGNPADITLFNVKGPLDAAIEDLERKTKPDPQRVNDELSSKAADLSNALLKMRDGASVQDKLVLDRANAELTQLRWEYVDDEMPPGHLSALLLSLDEAIQSSHLTADWVQKWEDLSLKAVAQNRFPKLSQMHPELSLQHPLTLEEVEQAIKMRHSRITALIAPENSSNSTSTKMNKTMEHLLSLKNSDTDVNHQKMYTTAWIAVGMLGKAAEQISNSNQPDKQAKVHMIEQLIDDLDRRLDSGSLTQQSLKEWATLVQSTLQKAQ